MSAVTSTILRLAARQRTAVASDARHVNHRSVYTSAAAAFVPNDDGGDPTTRWGMAAGLLIAAASGSMALWKDDEHEKNGAKQQQQQSQQQQHYASSALTSNSSSTTSSSTFTTAATNNTNSTNNNCHLEPRRSQFAGSMAKEAKGTTLGRFQSMRGRGLNEKYTVDWKQVLGEGAYGSVHPARLAATGEKVWMNCMYVCACSFFDFCILMPINRNDGMGWDYRRTVLSCH